MFRHTFRLLPLALLLLASCVTVNSGPPKRQANMSPWIQATPKLQATIDDNVERLPWTHGIERIELIQWFAGVGESGYGALLELVTDSREDVACAALAALGSTRDSRLVEPLRALPWPTEEQPDLTLERARTLLRLGDWSMLGHLVAGLNDNRVMIRALCSQALFEATREDFDFDANGSEENRKASIDRWNRWWAKREADPLR